MKELNNASLLHLIESKSSWRQVTIGEVFRIYPYKSKSIIHDGHIHPYYCFGGSTKQLEGYRLEGESLMIYLTEREDGFAIGSYVVDGKFGWVPCQTALQPTDPNINLSYVSLALGQYHISSMLEGEEVLSVNSVELHRIPLLLPDRAEQDRIVAQFAHFDTLLKQERDSFSHLQSVRSELLRQLLPVAGESYPAIRFPQCKGEWTTLHLGDCTTQHTSIELNKLAVVSNPSHLQCPFYKSSELSYLTRIYFRHVNPYKYVNPRQYSTPMIPKKSVVFSRSPLCPDVNFIVEQDCVISPLLLALKADNKQLTDTYLYYLLESINKRNYCHHTFLSKRVVAGISISIPCDIAEQERIVQCLSSVDDYMEQITQQCHHLKTLRNALAQIITQNN